MRKKTKKKQNKKWLGYLLLGGILAKFFVWLFNLKTWRRVVDNFGDFADQEQTELAKVVSRSESVSEYVAGSSSLFKDYFIPNYNNDHRPKILRPKSLLWIVVLAVVIKVAILGYIFWLYPNQARMSEEIANQLVQLTNQERLANGFKPYHVNSELSAAALAKAQDMLEQDYFAHHSPDGRKPWDWIDRNNYRYLLVGENLAMNFSTSQAAHNALMQSLSHRENILNQDYEDIGLAVVSGDFDGQPTNILVEIFAQEQPPVQAATTVESPSTPIPEAELAEAKAQEIAILSAQPALNNPTVSTPASQPEELAVADREPLEPVADANFIAPNESMPSRPAQVKLSPNLLLETNPNQEVSSVEVAGDSQEGWLTKIINWSRYLYLAVLAVLIICLLINIIVRISIQHKPVIIQTILVIILLGGLALVHFHLVENLLGRVSLV